MLVHCQYWAVFYAGVSVSTENTLTPIQRGLNVGPASSALAGITRAVRLSGWARDYNEPCRPTYDTLIQCRLNVVPPYLTPVQPKTSIVSQRMSTKRKICWLKVFSGTGHSIPRLGWCWGNGINSGPALNQHCVNMGINSIFRDLPIHLSQ